VLGVALKLAAPRSLAAALFASDRTAITSVRDSVAGAAPDEPAAPGSDEGFELAHARLRSAAHTTPMLRWGENARIILLWSVRGDWTRCPDWHVEHLVPLVEEPLCFGEIPRQSAAILHLFTIDDEPARQLDDAVPLRIADQTQRFPVFLHDAHLIEQHPPQHRDAVI
jgi:hypothetical protein